MTFVSSIDRFDLGAAGPPTSSEQDRLESAYKLVETFGSITGRPLKLQDGPTPCVDGNLLVVPLQHPAAYKLLSHELAHVLFDTNVTAAMLFVDEYVRQVGALVVKHELPFGTGHKAALTSLLQGTLNVLECRRVESLWGLIYSGDHTFGRDLAKEEATEKLSASHESFPTFLSIVEAAVETPVGRFTRFEPYCVEALKKVERRGQDATFVAAKWLVTQLVSELLQEKQPFDELQGESLSDPENPEGTPLDPPGNEDSDSDEDPPDDGMSMHSDAGGVSIGSLESGSMEGLIPKGAKNSGAKGNPASGEVEDGPGSGKWQPPKVEASQAERAKALSKLIEDSKPTGEVKKSPDVQKTDTPSREAAKAAAHLASEALKADVSKQESLTTALSASQTAMESRVDQAKTATRPSFDQGLDEHVKGRVPAKVVFRDIKSSDVLGITSDPLTPDDLLTIRKLRAMFSQVMGKKRSTLEQAGYQVDVQAAIARRVTKLPIPVFRQEIRGRGFEALLLLDRTNSMRGDKQKQSERAARIISRALRYPFVRFDVWGFQSFANGQIDLTRFDSKLDVFTTAKSPLGGLTPLHLAIRCGQEYLTKSGSGNKHMFAITDGLPVYYAKDGSELTPRQRLIQARDEVFEARKRGVSVTGAVIGEVTSGSLHFELGPKELGFIFGANRYWSQLDPSVLSQSMVGLVSSSFVEFLQSR